MSLLRFAVLCAGGGACRAVHVRLEGPSPNMMLHSLPPRRRRRLPALHHQLVGPHHLWRPNHDPSR